MKPEFGYSPTSNRCARLIEGVQADILQNEARYLPVEVLPEVPDTYGWYKYAEELAAQCNLATMSRLMARLNGSFIFGDFIEAFFTTYNLHTARLVISTYSLSQNNIDSLALLLNNGYVDTLDLIISDTFYSHERAKGKLIPYAYQILDRGDRFQLAVCGTHDKLCHFITDAGSHVSIYGSANLRSSGSIEHITIEKNKDVYEFFVSGLDRILAQYKTINKSLRHSALWHQVVPPTAA